MYRRRKKRLTPKQYQTIQQKKDKGTKELQQKRKSMLTSEPLDVCLARNMINQDQYEAGQHLKTLFGLKHGRALLQCSDPFARGKSIPKKQREAWLAKQQLIYKQLMKEINQNGYYTIITDVCIHCIWPSFLYVIPQQYSQKERNELLFLQQGLDLVTKVSSKHSSLSRGG